MPAPAPLHPAELRSLLEEQPDARVIDVRTPGEFQTRHIPGSYNVPLDTLGEHREELRHGLHGPVVLVCESGRRAASAEERLREAGPTQVHVLDGGVAAWEAAGGDLKRGEARWSLERQVRLVAGAIVLVSVLASLAWEPARFVAGAIGLGLTVAALTNTCAMGMLLAKLPYNTRGAATCDLSAVVAELTRPQEASAR